MKKLLLLTLIALSFNACKKDPITPDPVHYAVRYKMEGWKTNIKGYEYLSMKTLNGWQHWRSDTILFTSHHIEFEYGIETIPYADFKPKLLYLIYGADSAIFTTYVADTVYYRVTYPY